VQERRAIADGPDRNKLWVSFGECRAVPKPGRAIVKRVTFVERPADYTGVRTNTDANMKNNIDPITLMTALFVAGYVAIMLDHVAIVDLGFSHTQIRNTAVITAIVMAMLMAIDFLSKRLGKAGRPR
jgi:hypothetical protein